MIRTEEEGFQAMCKVLQFIKVANKEAPERPLVALLYLQFKSEKALDKWTQQFELVTQQYWKDVTKKPSLHFAFISKEDERNAVDVFVAETAPALLEIVEKRFPGFKSTPATASVSS